MIIEFTNVTPTKGHSSVSVAIVVASCAFFFIPTTLIVLGYLSSRPTGTLISPLPQGVVSEYKFPNPTPTPGLASISEDSQTITPSVTPIIAAPNDSTSAASANVVPESNSNIIDKTASVPAGATDVDVENADIKTTSQIYLSPRPGDKAIYSVKNKQEGKFTISVNSPSDSVRYIDYHIVNP